MAMRGDLVGEDGKSRLTLVSTKRGQAQMKLSDGSKIARPGRHAQGAL